MSRIRAGVLALQGDCDPHRATFAALGVDAFPVRRREEIEELTHLVIPGGESTTIRRLLDLFGLEDPIVRAHREGRLALFGTCAGAILLGRDDGSRPRRLSLLDATFERNAYGSQVDSFRRTLPLRQVGALAGPPFPCTFIRAPRVVGLASIGPSVEVLATDGESPILLRQGRLLAATFHPELSGDLRVHRFFLALGAEAAVTKSA